MPDTISISDLQIHLANGLGPSAFGLTPPPPCPVSITLAMHLEDGIVSGDEDTMLGLGVNYSSVSKQVYAVLSDPSRTFGTASQLAVAAAAVPLALAAVAQVFVEITLPRALLHARAAKVDTMLWREDIPQGSAVALVIESLQVACVIGLHPHEKAERQRLEVDMSFAPWHEEIGLKRIADVAFSYLENSSFGTLESLGHSLAEVLMESIPDSYHPLDLRVTIRKPSALPFGEASILIVRDSYDPPEDRFQPRAGPSTIPAPSAPVDAVSRRIFIALGSNIGDRLSHFNRAISLLQSAGLTLVRTGRLYESEPMYVEDQARFMNSAIEVRGPANVDAMGILRILKKVESEVGRRKTFTNGPRVVDLDLVYFGEEVIRIGKKGDGEDEDGVGWLEVPHWGLGEREFVLRPLVDIAPDFIDPRLRVPLRTLLARLPKTTPPQLHPLIPFPSPAAPMPLHQPTLRIMAIINATPDSFSDGSPSNLSVPHVLSSLREMFTTPRPPHILDIGGMSTRPHSSPCSESEEVDRVVPLIQAIRALGPEEATLRDIPISVDTYRPSVARAAVEAGASMINDVRGGREVGMSQMMADLGVPVVLMHSRGDSTSMTTSALQDYSELGGVVSGVRKELGDVIRMAEEAGVKRWNIILDPGLGFAKSAGDNLVLLRRIEELTAPGSGLEGIPVLVGGSRKGFVGKSIGREVASERGYGDAGVLVWCMTTGKGRAVDVVRVHDPRAAGEVMDMIAAIRDAE